MTRKNIKRPRHNSRQKRSRRYWAEKNAEMVEAIKEAVCQYEGTETFEEALSAGLSGATAIAAALPEVSEDGRP